MEFETGECKNCEKLADRIAALERKYNELIMAVATKYPCETRHETALRYIKQAECRTDNCEQAQKGEGDGTEV